MAATCPHCGNALAVRVRTTTERQWIVLLGEESDRRIGVGSRSSESFICQDCKRAIAEHDYIMRARSDVDNTARLRIHGEPGTRICRHHLSWAKTDRVIPGADGYIDVRVEPGAYSLAGYVYDPFGTRYTHVTAGLVKVELAPGDDEEVTLKPLTTCWAPGNITVLAVRGGDAGTGIETWWYEQREGEWTWFYKDTADEEGLVAWEECFWDAEDECGCWARFIGQLVFPIVPVSDHAVSPTDSLVARRKPHEHADTSDLVAFRGEGGRYISERPLPRYDMAQKWPWREAADHVIEWELLDVEGSVAGTFEVPTAHNFVIGSADLRTPESIPNAAARTGDE